MKIVKSTLLAFLTLLLFTGCNFIDSMPLEVISLESWRSFEPNNVYYLDGNELNLKIKEPIEEQQQIAFSEENFLIKISLAEEVEKEVIASFITVEPELKYQLKRSEDNMSWDFIPDNWEIGQEAKIAIAGLKGSFSFILRKVSQPVITHIDIAKPANRQMPGYCVGTANSLYILSGSTMNIAFSQPMDKTSVTSLIDEYISSRTGCSVAYHWHDEQNLQLTFINDEDIIYSDIIFSLTGAKATNGGYLQDDEGFCFSIANSDILTSLDLNDFTKTSVLDCGLINSITMSEGSQYIAYTDMIESFVNNGDVPDTSYQLSYLNIYSVDTGQLVTDSQIVKTNNYSSNNIIWSGDEYFFYFDTVYNNSGEKILSFEEQITSAVFAPDQTKIGVMYNRDTGDELNREVMLVVYDLETGQHLQDFSLASYSFATSNNDFTILNALWLTDDAILFENLHGKINLLNMNQSEKVSLLEGDLTVYDRNYQCSISPNMQLLIAYQPEHTFIYDVQAKQQVYQFPAHLVPLNIVWSPDSSFLIFNERNSTQLYKLDSSYVLHSLPVSGTPIGFYDQNNLLYQSQP